MLYELTKRDFRRISFMVDKHTNLEAQAVINGNNPGWVFVEDPDDPSSALVWSQGIEGFYLMGSNANPRFNSVLLPYIDTELLPRMKDKQYTKFEVSGTHKKWDATIEKLFKGRDLKSFVQRVYTYTLKAPPQSKPLPKGFAIVPVDKKLLSSSLENSTYVVEELEKCWHSIRVFLHDGFAYCVINNDAIASICYVSFVSGKTYAVGVETFAGYKQQGFASAVAAECVMRALKEKVIPYWDCSVVNTGSVKTAEGLGFTKQWEYNCFAYKLD